MLLKVVLFLFSFTALASDVLQRAIEDCFSGKLSRDKGVGEILQENQEQIAIKIFFYFLDKLLLELRVVRNLKIDKARILDFFKIFYQFGNLSLDYITKTVDFSILRDHVNTFYDSLHEWEQRMLPERKLILTLVFKLSNLREVIRKELQSELGQVFSDEPLFVVKPYDSASLDSSFASVERLDQAFTDEWNINEPE